MQRSMQLPHSVGMPQRRWLASMALLALMILPSLTGITIIFASVRVPQAALAAQGFTVVPFQVNSPAAQENQQPGTTSWELDPRVNTTFIQGYAGAVSAQAGDTVPLYISTVVPATYTLSVFRIGWYNGLGGRLMLTVPHLQSLSQGFWTSSYGLVDCTRCQFDPKTHLLDAHWLPSYHLLIPSGWQSGVYLIKLSVGRIAESYIPLVVRADQSTSSVLLNIPINTYEAYNIWGGYSLYQHVGQTAANEESNTTRASKVSFNRPFDRSAGVGDFFYWDLHTVRWVERSALDVTYTTSMDVAVRPATLLQHRIYLDSGHDEYWTKSMRDGIERARDLGVNLAFLGADDSYWQARLEPDAAANANRTLVCYKVATTSNNPSQYLANDPMYPAHPELVTAQWRDPVVHRPENSLLGLMYNSYFAADGRYVPDLVITSSHHLDQMALMAGLVGGEHLRTGLVGYEYDSEWQNGFTPKNLVVLARSPVINIYHQRQVASTSYYRAASGAIVFDAGTLWWANGLDNFIPPGTTEQPFFHETQVISNLTANLIRVMLTDNTDLFTTVSLGPLPNPVPLPTSDDGKLP